MDQPKIPTLKDSQKPQVKVRGLGIGLTLAERLKQFKKKDLAFILAGLGVLFMAPLAEHFMMAPESADGSLQAGWGKGGSGSGGPGANGVFGAGGSPYDRTDGLAPGSPTGGGSDVITPLNVRDPSALVMGPGAAQQPPTNSALPATPPASAPAARSDSDLKDALAASARGVGAAAKKAPMPVPKVALGGSGLRGLSAASGGSSASASLGPISAANVPNRASGGDSTGNARSTKGYNGVARGQTAGSSGIEALKAAAGKQAENMNRGTGAATDLNETVKTAIPSGGDGRGGGGPGSGKEDKGGGGNNDKNSKSTGESLAFLDKKARMEKDRELEYKKKELNDYGLLWSQMRNEGLKTFFSEGLVKPVSSWTGDAIKGLLTPEKAKSVYKCSGGTDISAGAVGTCGEGATYAAGTGNGNSNIQLFRCTVGKEHSQAPELTGCTKVVSGEEKKNDGRGTTVDNADGVASGMSSTQISSLSDLCKLTQEIKNPKVDPNSTTKAVYDDKLKTWAGNVQTGATRIARTQFALVGGTNIKACEPEPADLVPSVGISKSVKESQAEALAKLAGSGVAKSADDLISKTKAGAIVEEKKLDAIETKDAEGAVKTAADGVKAVEDYMKASKPTLDENYGGDVKTLGKDLAAAVVASNGQLTDARNALDATYKTLKSVQDGIDTANDKTRVKPQVVDMTKTVVSVSEQNVSLAQFGKDLTEGKYKDLGFTIDKVRKIEKARSASDTETTAAVGTAKEKIAAAKTAVEEFDKKKKKADSDKKTADADLQVDPQMSTQVTRDAVQTSKNSKTEADSAHETAQTAIKTAVTTVGDMRESQIGWADVMKTAADGLAKTVASPPAPAK